MRHTREILRHKWLLESSHRLVTSSLAVSHGSITDTTQRALRAGLCWDSVCALLDSVLERLLYPPPPSAGTPRPEPDFVTVDLELRRRGVTLELLHQEYLALHPEGYRRSSFCAHYEVWKRTRGLKMRQVHQGGDRLFVDAGLKAYYTDPTTFDSVACELFLATLGASSYTYAEASPSKQVLPCLPRHRARLFRWSACSGRQRPATQWRQSALGKQPQSLTTSTSAAPAWGLARCYLKKSKVT